MKKLLVALITCAMLVTLSACDDNQTTEDMEIIPLTINSLSREIEKKGLTESVVPGRPIETEEGIEITCSSDNYMLGYLSDPHLFWFQELFPLEEEQIIKLTSNAEIIFVNLFDDMGKLIQTEKCENNTAIIKESYGNKPCNSFILYILRGTKLFSINFIRE